MWDCVKVVIANSTNKTFGLKESNEWKTAEPIYSLKLAEMFILYSK